MVCCADISTTHCVPSSSSLRLNGRTRTATFILSVAISCICYMYICMMYVCMYVWCVQCRALSAAACVCTCICLSVCMCVSCVCMCGSVFTPVTTRTPYKLITRNGSFQLTRAQFRIFHRNLITLDYLQPIPRTFHLSNGTTSHRAHDTLRHIAIVARPCTAGRR